ncbi:hypothetical protein AVEN_12469-1 [Araneus ventricosus]|uniref:Uncharacterized protein n=1 Tax=Araneus ventricosus TaxID=182803 RepID=A0A4Y2ITH7_ARAVE|nr:hypothetical protein AVEN_12469-1 [Araneus ventricosus]
MVDLVLLSLKRYEIEGKSGNKLVEHRRFSTKRHLMVMNAKNRTLKMHICLFAASETLTTRNLNEKRKDYLCACAQNIISEAVPSGGIRGTNNRVWWFPRVTSTFTCSDSTGLFPVGMSQTAGVCDPSANIAGPSMTHYGYLCQRGTHYATPCAT